MEDSLDPGVEEVLPVQDGEVAAVGRNVTAVAHRGEGELGPRLADGGDGHPAGPELVEGPPQVRGQEGCQGGHQEVPEEDEGWGGGGGRGLADSFSHSFFFLVFPKRF